MAPVVAYAPERESPVGPADAAQLFALRATNSAYGASAGSNGVRLENGATEDGSMRPPELWGGGLFTNTARASGPLILIGSPLAK